MGAGIAFILLAFIFFMFINPLATIFVTLLLLGVTGAALCGNQGSGIRRND